MKLFNRHQRFFFPIQIKEAKLCVAWKPVTSSGSWQVYNKNIWQAILLSSVFFYYSASDYVFISRLSFLKTEMVSRDELDWRDGNFGWSQVRIKGRMRKMQIICKTLFAFSLCHSTIFHSARSIGILIFIYGFKTNPKKSRISIYRE